MSLPEDVIVGKRVPFSEAEVKQATQPALSEKVVQVIVSSGVGSLQVLLSTGRAEAVEAAIRRYWNIG
jgi:hypothetical protein